MPDWLFYTSLLAALTLTICLCASVSSRSRAGGPVRSNTPRAWIDGALMCLTATAFLYVGALYLAAPADGDASYDCTYDRFGADEPPRGLALRARDVTLFPVQAVCRWSDGQSSDAVPAWINPVLYMLLVAAVMCATAAVLARKTRVRQPN